MFLELEVTVYLLRNVVVSVLLPVVEFLRSSTCSHLVSLPHNVGLDDLETVVPAVDDKPRRNVLSCLGSLHGLEPLVDLLVPVVLLGPAHVHVGLDGDGGDGSVELPVVVGEGVGGVELNVLVGEDGGDSTFLVIFVLDQASLLCLDHTSECITKYELEILIERLEGFRRFIPLNDGEEPCNGDLLGSLIKW
jgi:hypothetical protein